MKRIKFIITGLLIVLTTSAQQFRQAEKLQQVGSELSMQFEELGNISLNSSLKLKELYRIDVEFKAIESLGKPVNITYKDHVGYETWRYEYTDMVLDLINQNGYITIQSVTFIPSTTSTFKIADKTLVSKTKLREIASFKPNMLNKADSEVNVFVKSPQESRVSGVKFKIILNENQKTVKEVRIDFDNI